MRYFFDESLDGAHDAMVDVVACRRLYVLMSKLGANK
jgi:DNA polymerase III epsilon subunit-like protein